MTLESALRARTLAAPPPPDTPPPPASLTPPQPLIDKTPLRQYRFPTRPSTSYIELRPTGSLSEKFIVDMKLAAGPSARRGHGSDCLGRAALLGLSEGAKRPRLGSPELCSSPRLEMSASLPSL